MRIAWVGIALVGVVGSCPRTARADVCRPALGGGSNWMAGPIFGVQLSGRRGVIVGLEGGAGCGPERLNAGIEYRAGAGFGYVEFDPWLFLGASVGVGVDTNGDVQPVLGLWEGVPVHLTGSCAAGEHQSITTVSLGYRFTGVHELYIAVKAGTSTSTGCWD